FSYVPPPLLLPIGPFAARFNFGPNVVPLSLLALNTGFSVPFLAVSQYATYTLFASARIPARSERVSEELLRLTVFSNVFPPSGLLAKNTSQFPVFLSHETM